MKKIFPFACTYVALEKCWYDRLDTFDSIQVNGHQLLVTFPQQCSLWFHLKVMQPLYCFYLDSHNRMCGEAWQEMKCQQFFMHYYCLLLSTLEREENGGGMGGLDVTEKPQLLLLCNMQNDIPTVVKEGPLIPTAQDARTAQFDCQIWLAVPSSLFSILRRWLLMSWRSTLCHCLPALSVLWHHFQRAW